jgi:hypothetical protein
LASTLTDHASALEVLKARAERRGHLGITENVERLDEALVDRMVNSSRSVDRR